MSEMPPPPPPPSMPAGQPASSKPPQDYMTLSIVATVLGVITCTCIPLITGIIAIVFSNKARQAWAAGDVNGYQSAVSTAKILMIISFAVIALGIVLNIILLATGNFYYDFSTN